MPASFPASMVNQKPPDLGIPNRFSLNSSRFSRLNSAISSSLESPSVVSRMRDLGLDEVNGNGVIFKQPIKAASMK
jgi:hypothetical protein